MFFSPEKYSRLIPSVNEELLKIEGELPDKEAKLALHKFLRANLGFTCELLSGIKLAAYQQMILKGWFNRNYSLMVASRGGSKSFLAAIFCWMYLIFNPGAKIIIAGPTFRTARNIFTEIEKMVKGKDAILLRQAITEESSRRTDLFTWNINGGSITAIPLSGNRIRGFRASVLIIDEFLLLTEDMVEKVLMPFLVANDNIKERLQISEEEKELIQLGLMKEEEKTIFEENNKMICLSSASYKFEYLYKKFQQWQDLIYSPEKQGATYFIAQISYQALPTEMISKTVIEEAEAGGISSPNFQREYLAMFTDGSDGYFSAKKMEDCSLKPGQEPYLTLTGNPDKKYILSIDSNFNNSKLADHFAMCVVEYDHKTGYGGVVHQYANAEADLKSNVDYFYYLLTHFNIVMIILDLAGGRRFIDSANLSEKFRMSKIKLSFFDLDSNKEAEDYNIEIINARNQYNLFDKKICLEQHFATDWIRKANEYLQTNINYKRVYFGSKIRPDDFIFQTVIAQEVDTALLGFEGSPDAIKGEAIDEQDNLIKLVKEECSLIEVGQNAQGTQTFDIPQHLRRDRSPTRARKDSYTALMLANWACKCYFDLMSYKPRVVQNTFIPSVVMQLD